MEDNNNMEGVTEYTGPDIILGIDDLYSCYAFYGASQGDETKTNSVSSYLGSDGWLLVSSFYKDIDYLNQSEVDSRTEELKLKNSDYILSLKNNGNFGKRTKGITFTLKNYPLYDTPSIYDNFINKPITSYRMTYIDFTKK